MFCIFRRPCHYYSYCHIPTGISKSATLIKCWICLILLRQIAIYDVWSHAGCYVKQTASEIQSHISKVKNKRVSLWVLLEKKLQCCLVLANIAKEVSVFESRSRMRSKVSARPSACTVLTTKLFILRNLFVYRWSLNFVNIYYEKLNH